MNDHKLLSSTRQFQHNLGRDICILLLSTGTLGSGLSGNGCLPGNIKNHETIKIMQSSINNTTMFSYIFKAQKASKCASIKKSRHKKMNMSMRYHKIIILGDWEKFGI